MTALFVSPVWLFAVEKKTREPARNKVFSNEGRAMSMVFQHARKPQLRAAVAEIHGGFLRLHHKIGEVITGRERRENAVAVPSPGNHAPSSEVGGEMPIVFEGIFFHAAVKPIVVPAGGNQHSFTLFQHGSSVLYQMAQLCTILIMFCIIL